MINRRRVAPVGNCNIFMSQDGSAALDARQFVRTARSGNSIIGWLVYRDISDRLAQNALNHSEDASDESRARRTGRGAVAFCPGGDDPTGHFDRAAVTRSLLRDVP